MTVIPLIIAVFFIVYELLMIKKALVRERIELDRMSGESIPPSDLRIVFTVKNGGEKFQKVLKHYLHLGLKVAVYDDSSNDGTWEFLQNEQQSFQTLLVFPLLRDSRSVHPKALAIEDAVRRFTEPYLLILDADSVIERSAFPHALNLLRRYDVVSLKRRNPGNGLVVKIADTEEVTNTCLIATGLSKNMFFGSGFFFRRSMFESLTFRDGVLSEDSEFGFQVRRKNARYIQLLTLEVKEEAPRTFSKLVKQRFRWLFAGSIFNFSRYPLSSWTGTSLFTFIAIGTLARNPLALSLLSSFIFWNFTISFAAQRISKIPVKEIVWRSAVFACFYTLVMVWIFPFIVFIHPLLWKKFQFTPTRY